MKRSNSNTARFWTGHASRLATVIMFGWTTTVYPVLAQTSSQPGTAPAPPPMTSDTAQAQGYSMTDLEYLLGPIALYPDPLLALILPASGFPDQIVEAERWISANPQAVQQNDFTQVDAKPWDPSVQALTRFPDVIKMLSEHLDWTNLWLGIFCPTDRRRDCYADAACEG